MFQPHLQMQGQFPHTQHQLYLVIFSSVYAQMRMGAMHEKRALSVLYYIQL